MPLDSAIRRFVIQDILLSDFTHKVNLSACMCLHVCVCVCVHACVRVCVHVHINADIIMLNFVCQTTGSLLLFHVSLRKDVHQHNRMGLLLFM